MLAYRRVYPVCQSSFKNLPQEEHFLGGRLRAEAMCDFGRTAICLVWARPDSMDWPLMPLGEDHLTEL